MIKSARETCPDAVPGGGGALHRLLRTGAITHQISSPKFSDPHSTKQNHTGEMVTDCHDLPFTVSDYFESQTLL